MKTILTSLALVFYISLSASTVEFTAFDNQFYVLNINGQRYDMTQGSLNFTNVLPGNYTIEISKFFPQNYYGNKMMPIVFLGNITIQPNTFAQYIITQNDLVLAHLSALPPQQPIYVPLPVVPVDPPSTVVPPIIQPNPISVCPTPPNLHPEAMSLASFNQLLSLINEKSFSSNKMSVFKQALSSNFFTTNQVIAVMDAFTFSNDKLEVAKAAYGNTVDPQNYFLVNEAFDYSSQIRELNDYINDF